MKSKVLLVSNLPFLCYFTRNETDYYSLFTLNKKIWRASLSLRASHDYFVHNIFLFYRRRRHSCVDVNFISKRCEWRRFYVLSLHSFKVSLFLTIVIKYNAIMCLFSISLDLLNLWYCLKSDVFMCFLSPIIDYLFI